MIYLGTFLEINPLVVLILSGLSIGLIKYCKKNFDLVGYVNSSRTNILSWMRELEGRK
jgi:hypothetical protein